MYYHTWFQNLYFFWKSIEKIYIWVNLHYMNCIHILFLNLNWTVLWSKISSFWVRLNAIPTCVIIVKLFWPSVFQYITTNHASGYIVVHVKFPKPDFIWPNTQSWRYIILSHLPSQWMWHSVYLIWSCPVFSIIFRIKYVMSLQWSFWIHIW